jgi:outer membrane lipoprotein-sorting protein
VRVKPAAFAALLPSFVLFFMILPSGAAQNPDTLLPEQSAAKAKQILQQLTDALGGARYLNVRESDCEGRLARFGHNGELTGYTNFKDYWGYPDKNRTDYSKKGVIINLYNGDKGWTLDRGGVSELPAPAVADFQELVKKDINNLLRYRIKEPDMIFRYGGQDIVDLKTVDWVEITDPELRTFRLAVDRSSHFFVRTMIITEDQTTRERSVETSIYSNFQPIEGVKTPLQITSDRDGRRISQVFFTSCKFNPGLGDDFFTKAALEKRFSEVGSKKYKEEKKKEKTQEEDNN